MTAIDLKAQPDVATRLLAGVSVPGRLAALCGRSKLSTMAARIGIALMIGLAAAVAGLVLRALGRRSGGMVEAFAAGAILALVSETMIPEAFHGSPQFNGLLLVVGFVALLILLVLSH